MRKFPANQNEQTGSYNPKWDWLWILVAIAIMAAIGYYCWPLLAVMVIISIGYAVYRWLKS